MPDGQLTTVICIPTYNERESIVQTVTEVLDLNRPEISVMVVDDNSPDGTCEVVEEARKLYPGRILLIKRDGKLGLGSAYRVAFSKALELGADLIVEMDADGSHDPRELPKLIDAVPRECDVAIGSRRIPGGRTIGWGTHRQLMSRGAMWVSRTILGLRPYDVTSGFRCYHRKVVEKLLAIGISSGGYAFQEETLFLCQQHGFRIAEIPITFRERRFGKSKLSWKDVAEFFRLMLFLRFKRKAV